MSYSNRNRRHLLVNIAAILLLASCLEDSAIPQQSSPDARFGNAVHLSNSTSPGDAETACDIMKQLVLEFSTNQEYERSRRIICVEVKNMLDIEKRSADDGIQLARSGNCSGARGDYEKILQLGTRDSKYRDQLKAEVISCEKGMSAISADRARIDRG